MSGTLRLISDCLNVLLCKSKLKDEIKYPLVKLGCLLLEFKPLPLSSTLILNQIHLQMQGTRGPSKVTCRVLIFTLVNHTCNTFVFLVPSLFKLSKPPAESASSETPWIPWDKFPELSNLHALMLLLLPSQVATGHLCAVLSQPGKQGQLSHKVLQESLSSNHSWKQSAKQARS